MQVSEIIARLGGAAAAAKQLGLKRTTVTMWGARGQVPPRHVPAVARALNVPPETIWPALATPQPVQEAA